jgi:hypothetical protein
MPPVWRRIVVESGLTLGELAPVLEAAMGWLGGHLHVFDVGGTRYGTPDPDWGMDDLDENRFRLGDVLPKVGTKMRWDYDFGDGWEHDVLVEAISMRDRGVEYPVCLAGRRACPPEDCGGPWGYADLLEALADPDHRRARASPRVGAARLRPCLLRRRGGDRGDALALATRGLGVGGQPSDAPRLPDGTDTRLGWDASAVYCVYRRVGRHDRTLLQKLPLGVLRYCRQLRLASRGTGTGRALIPAEFSNLEYDAWIMVVLPEVWN